MSAEERLLKAIFTESEPNIDEYDSEVPDNYPDTYSEKAHYTEFCIQKSLEHTARTLNRISRLRGLLQAGQKDGKDALPDIFTNNESRMALEHLIRAKRDIEDAYQELLVIFQSTGKAKESNDV